MKKIWIGSLVGVAVVLAIGATVTMTMTDRYVDQAIARAEGFSNGQYELDVVEDNKGFTERQVTIALRVNQADSPATVFIENTLIKRPWGSSITHVVLLDDFSEGAEIDADDPMLALIRANFIDQPFAEGQTSVSLLGQYTSQWQTREIRETIDEATIAFNSMNIQASGNIAGDVVFSADWPGFSMSSSGLQPVEMVFLPMNISAEGRYVDGSLFTGVQTVSGEGFTFVSDSEWDSNDVRLGAYEMSTTAELDGNELQASLTSSVSSLTVVAQDQSLSLKDVNTQFSVAGIDADSYQGLVRELNAMQTTGVPSPALISHANQLIQQGFDLRLDAGHVQVENSDVDFSLALSIPENSVADLNNPFTMMGLVGQLSATADLAIDASIMDVELLYDPMMQLLMSGALVNEGDRYQMAFSMENGLPMLNGEPLPLPF